MATSIASQLQALKSVVKADTEPLKKPFTRPSILFNPKDAADIDVDTIFSLAFSGLEVLISKEERFRNYKNDLFSHKSRELDRELTGIEENNRINAAISSYLRLLSGYFELIAARRTLEYLIRRYKIHVYNTEELILCALPYHDTHEFVRVVQLIDTGNSRWKFLDGVKASGAPPPRKVIVQQCIRDLGVMEVICNYAMPSKKIQPMRTVTGFCTSTVIEVLGSMTTVNSDAVKRILPYVVSGLESGARENPEQKAGALMIVGLLAQKVALSPNLVRSLIRSVVDVAQDDAKQSNDLQWFRMSLMALINLVQLQNLELIPRKTLDILLEIRDIPEVFGGLTEEFNIDKFLTVFLDSLLEYSLADLNYHGTLLSTIESVPLKFYIDCLVSKLLRICMKISRHKDQSNASKSAASQLKEILVALYKKYPVELRQAIHKILQDTEVQSGKDGSYRELFSRILDGDSGFSLEFPDSKIWFALEHPKAEVRRSALMGLDVAVFLRDKDVDSKMFDIVQDAILRRLQDDDLTVIQAVLNVQSLNQMISSSVLLDTIQSVLDRCIQILLLGASDKVSIASDVAVSCLQLAIASFKDQDECTKTLATMIFPLVLILPKTQKVNLRALELANELKWPFYRNLIGISASEKKLRLDRISSINLENINKLAEEFRMHHEVLIPWLLECSNGLQLSKILFFLILLQSFMVPKLDFVQFSALYDASFPILEREWEMLESAGNVSYADESNLLDGDCRIFVEHLFDKSIIKLNSEILICLFWRLVEAFILTAPDNDKTGMWSCKLHNLYVFFASQSNQVFKKHLHYLVTKCKSLRSEFLLKMFTEEGVSSLVLAESLHSFLHLCSQSDENLGIQLLAEFPSVLVPLASNDQDVRMAAISCIEGLFTMWSRLNNSRSKNGNGAVWIHFLGEFLGLLVQQKRLILSDPNVLPSIFKSLLGSITDSLLVQQHIGKRFDQSTKDDVLVFLLGSALGLSDYGKLKILSFLKGLGSKVTEITGVKSLLYDLLERRYQYHILHNKLSQKLSKTDVDILCLLLEICTMPTSSVDRHQFDDLILVKALEIYGNTSDDPAVVEPCITLLKNLSGLVYGGLKAETQEILFRYLVILFRNGNADVQNSTREALLKINISSSVVSKMLDFVVGCIIGFSGSTSGKKKKKPVTRDSDVHIGVFQQGENALSFLSSLLDVLILKKNIENRSSLIGSLFKILHLIFLSASDEQLNGTEDGANKYLEASSGVSQTVSSTRVYIQQTLLLILEDISSSVVNGCPEQDDIANVFDMGLLVKCARLASDAVTRNHVFSLVSTVVKIIPDKVLDHILDILNIIGESALTQWDSHSQRVFEDLISAVVPFWLSKTGDMEKLLQIFVDVLPQVSQHQRLSIIVNLLRNLGESRSFGSLLFLLFHSLASKETLFCFVNGEPPLDALTSVINTQWEYLFARQLSEQYSCMIWLPSLVLLLQRIGIGPWDEAHYRQWIVAMQFVLEKLQDPEISFMLDSGEDTDLIQITLGALMEQVVYLLQPVNARKKQMVVSLAIRIGLKKHSHAVFKTIAKGLVPLSYFKVIIQLLRHADKNIRKKALGLLSETVKERGNLNKIQERLQSRRSLRNSWNHLDETAQKSFNEMCLEILKLIDDSGDDSGGASLKLAAVSTLEVLAYSFPSDNPNFGACLKSVSKNICSNNSAVSSSCLRATSALIHVLGPRALSELPGIMGCMFSRSHDVSLSIAEETKSHDANSSIAFKESVLLSLLVTLEAVVDKLGGFLNPYLGNILELLVLHPWYASAGNVKLKLKADVVRKLVTDKIPVRLLLPPLLRTYTDAVKCGGPSVSVVFEMLGNMVNTMDRSAVSAYHVQIFDLGLLALDLRCQRLDSIKDIHVVEEKVISSIVCLTMKLTETMFKPLFVKSIEWSGSHMEERKGSKTIDRAISFYSLVNKLAESHRSLFVPYFKYLLDGCVHHLSEDTQVSLTRKKKKVKLQVAGNEEKDSGNELSLGLWHLRALILSSLHKCFLYDTGSLKFLDSSNFQALLKPIVLQLVRDPPSSLEEHPGVPSVKEFDDLLVTCVGQMAVTAGSDLLWKPLNHEVLMQTRSEKVRSRILGLRIVKYLVENLKEEYLVFLPETIPFLGELLEDVDLPVKILAQEILKEMEFTSGESLRQYL